MFSFFWSALTSAKGFFKFLTYSVLGIIIYNYGCDALQEVFTFISGQLQSSTSSLSAPVLALSGFAAWAAIHLRVPDILAFVITVFILKFTLRKIPFLRW